VLLSIAWVSEPLVRDRLLKRPSTWTASGPFCSRKRRRTFPI